MKDKPLITKAERELLAKLKDKMYSPKDKKKLEKLEDIYEESSTEEEAR
ncbi:MAG: hypothetical protein ABSF00_04180 [Candidatus Bathyarchaeia archaeon]|jgi:hypothetical protein